MFRTQIIHLILIFYLFQPSLSEAQTIIDINKAYDILHHENIDLQQAKINKLIAKQSHKDTKNNLLPSISFGIGHNYNFGLAFDQIAGQLITGNRWTNSANANLSARAVLFQGFNLRNQIHNSLFELESKNLEENKLRRSLKLNLLNHYFEAIANQEIHKSSLQQLNYAREQLKQLQEQFDLGTKTLVDVTLAESQVSTNELNVLVSKNSYETKILEIKQILNINYQDTLSLVTPDIEPIFVDQINYSIKDIILKDPNTVLAELRLRQSELLLKIAKNSYYPTINLSTGYGTNYSSERQDFLTNNHMPFWNQVNQNRSLNFGISLSAPILNGFKEKSNINKARLNISLQKNEISKTKQEQEKIILLAIQEYLRISKEYQVSQAQHKSLERAFGAMKERYELGVSNSIDFSKSLLEYNISEFNMIKTKYMLLYHIELLKLLTTEEG